MRVLTIIFCVCFTVTTFSQNYKFGKVSQEELTEKVCTIDSSANAVFLYKYRRSYFEYIKNKGFELITDVHERIKIYNQEGFNYATKQVMLYKSSNGGVEKISTIKANTYNLENGKVVEIKLSKDDVFKTEANKYNNKVKFTMPNIKEGSVIEYKYKITSPFWSNVDEFVFQHDIPIKKLKATFESPEYFNFKVSTKGFLSMVPLTKSESANIVFNTKTRSTGSGYTGATATSVDRSELEYTKYISEYDSENIPALKDEPYVNSINNYRSSAKYELSYTKFPNSVAETYASSWEDVVNRIYKSPSFGKELEKTAYFHNDIDALIGSVSDPIKKIELIFDFVKSHVKWNGYYGIYAKDVRKAYKEHTGNVADINLMLAAMLRYSGLNANPVLVSTRQHGIPLFPTREGFNYVICGVEQADNVFLLDATSKYSAPNVLPFRTLNWQGRIVRETGSSALIDLYPKKISKNTITLFLKLDETGSVEGQMRSVKTGHKARDYRNKYNSTDKNQFIAKLENKFHGMEIEDFEVVNNKNLEKPVIETCKFNIESQADIIDDKIYFSPLFFFKIDENPFKLEKREFPVDFGYPSDDVYRFNITLPKGYNVVSAPQSKKLQLPNDLGSFVYQVRSVGNTIQLIIDSKINAPIISPIHYNALKSYFSGLIEAENEQIVLTKT